MNWDDLKAKHDAEKRSLLMKYVNGKYTRQEVCSELQISNANLSNLCRRYFVEPNFKAGQGGPRGIGLQTYIDCAEKGMTQKETALYLGVSGSAVSNIAATHNIKFKRAKE